MRGTIRFVAFAAALLVVHAPASLAQDVVPIDDKTLEKAHGDFLAAPEMQIERPTEAEPDPVDPRPDRSNGWFDWLADAIGSFLTALGPVFRILFYLIVGGIVLALLYFIFGETLKARFGGNTPKEETPEDDLLEEFRPDAVAARSLLEEADALAKAGRFSEAVHLLLFRSIQDIQLKRGDGVPPSLTAREIGGLSSLPERARGALSPIIAIVERSFFGGRNVDEQNWKSARDSYESFAFGGSWT